MQQSQFVRLLIASATVGFWMASGWLLRLDVNSYLLVGVPLLLVFQIFIARRPVTELWLKYQPIFRLSWWAVLVAGLFMIYPVISLFQDWPRATLPIRLWGIAAILGAIPLAFTLMNATRMTWAFLLRCFLTAGLMGCSIMVLASVAKHHGFRLPPHAWLIAAGSFLLYLPICFIIEEVFFRGGLDSFIQRENDKYRWLTAIFLSCMWGWWHLPIGHTKDWTQFMVLVIMFPLIHCIPGIPFSIYWRKSGSLLVPAMVHAFIDSLRNALM